MKHDDCIFCKIIEGEIPSAKVYEDEHVYAFLDISQVSKGHTLVIPKVHTKDIYDLPAPIAGKLFERVPKIANALKQTYKPIGLNILNNNEAPAGQSVFHIHLHLLPKYNENEGFSAHWSTNEDKYSSDDLQQIAQEIQQAIEN